MDKRPYPRWWLDHAADRRRLLDASVERLRGEPAFPTSLVGLLIFGSYARNETGPDSDLDIIAVAETTESFAFRGRDIRRKLGELCSVPFDLIVYTPEEYERFSDNTAFLRQARAEGIWINATPSP